MDAFLQGNQSPLHNPDLICDMDEFHSPFINFKCLKKKKICVLIINWSFFIGWWAMGTMKAFLGRNPPTKYEQNE